MSYFIAFICLFGFGCLLGVAYFLGQIHAWREAEAILGRCLDDFQVKEDA